MSRQGNTSLGTICLLHEGKHRLFPRRNHTLAFSAASPPLPSPPPHLCSRVKQRGDSPRAARCLTGSQSSGPTPPLVVSHTSGSELARGGGDRKVWRCSSPRPRRQELEGARRCALLSQGSRRRMSITRASSDPPLARDTKSHCPSSPSTWSRHPRPTTCLR